MLGRILAMAAVVALACLLQPSVAAQAKTPIAKIQSAAARAIGASTDTVEVAVNGDALMVLRVNTKMNLSTHENRATEAGAIAAIAAKLMAKNAEFSALTTIRVQYIDRAEKGATTVVDSIEFQKTAAGAFELRKT
ncbi:MAG: hypothetical protein ACLP1D_08430 [Xanthobacteraceae bacterium]